MTSHLPSPFTLFPPAVLAALDQSFWAFNNTKFSYAELSHRSEHYAGMNQKALDLLRAYYSVPSNYHILLLPNQSIFAAIPFNINRFVNNSAIYLVNDAESELAYKDALKLNEKAVKISSLSQRKEVAPTLSEKPYYYYTFYNKLSLESGELQEEVEPAEGEILVCNLNYCSYYRGVNVEKHGVVFFDSGRGIGLTGLAVVIVRKDLVGFQLGTCPDMMCFEKNVTANSIVNTPFTLVPLLFAYQIEHYQRSATTLQDIEDRLKAVKEEYTNALQTRTEVVATTGVGILKFRIPESVPEEKWKEHGWKFGEYLVVLLQEGNQWKAAEFVNHIFQ